MRGIWKALQALADPHARYRTLSVTLTNFIPGYARQISLFDDVEAVERRERLLRTVDSLKVKYGQLSVMRALSCTEASTLKLRDGLIAGHKR
jgi:DNA polymerase V